MSFVILTFGLYKILMRISLKKIWHSGTPPQPSSRPLPRKQNNRKIEEHYASWVD